MKAMRMVSLFFLLAVFSQEGSAQQSSTTEEISKGAAVYQKKCQRCAALQKSGGARLKWRELIARERQRDPRWLTDEEARVLLIYLENPPL